MARQMKDSGIEWIGEIPVKWSLKRLKALFLERKEKNDPIKTDFILSLGASYGVVPYADKEGGGNKAKEDLTDYRLAYPNDIVMNSMNIISGSVGLSSYFGCASPVYYMLYPRNDDIDTHFYCYLFQTKAFQRSLLGLGNGILMKESSNGTFNTVRMRIPMEKLGIQLLPMPSFSEQQRIADFLDRKCAEIDAVIERTKATIEEYKKLKQAVITEAVTKGVRGPRPMKDSGIEWLGCLPNEWDCTKLKQVWISVDSGVSVNAADYPTENDSQFGVLKTSCVSKFVFLPNEHKQVDADEYARVACPVKKDTIIVSRMNTPDLVGACGYVDTDYPNLFLPDRLWQISFESDVMAKYVWYYLNNQMVRAYISSLSTGTSSSMQNISKPQFGGITIAIPSIEEQLEITAYLDEKCAALDTLIAKKTALLTELETYKKSLIYEHVTGKKEVQ